MAFEHTANALDCLVETLRHLAIGGFQLARSGRNRIQFGRQTGAVGFKGVNLGVERGGVAIAFDASIRGKTDRFTHLYRRP